MDAFSCGVLICLFIVDLIWLIFIIDDIQKRKIKEKKVSRMNIDYDKISAVIGDVQKNFNELKDSADMTVDIKGSLDGDIEYLGNCIDCLQHKTDEKELKNIKENKE